MSKYDNYYDVAIVSAVHMVWEYMLLGHALKPCDLIFVLGSRDDRTAQYGAGLFLKGLGKNIMVSGGAPLKNDTLHTKWEEATEAEHFGAIICAAGVPSKNIILETRAMNTGQNIHYGYDMINKLGIVHDTILFIQKPYMERRTYATAMKQWPDPATRFIVSSPPIDFDDYFVSKDDFDENVAVMVGDLERIIAYPSQGFQIPQKVPGRVIEAGNFLRSKGFNIHSLQQ